MGSLCLFRKCPTNKHVPGIETSRQDGCRNLAGADVRRAHAMTEVPRNSSWESTEAAGHVFPPPVISVTGGHIQKFQL